MTLLYFCWLLGAYQPGVLWLWPQNEALVELMSKQEKKKKKKKRI
jgi:hypothetical protein